MKLTVLVDNNTLIDRYFCGEPGVSYLIEEGQKKALFDLGYSDLFLRNARSMGLPLLDVEYLVLSHGHMDHTWGLEPLIRMHAEAAFEGQRRNKPVLIAHPHALLPRYIEGAGQVGISIDPERLDAVLDIRLSAEPVRLTDRLVFLGQIPLANDFEPRPSVGRLKDASGTKEDRLLDDSALAYRGREGLLIITGCSHAGICSIIEHARNVCQEERVVDVIGGLHLMNPPKKQLQKTAEFIGGLGLQALHACHCTDLESKITLSAVAPLKEVGVGLRLEYG
jgi:7,8-dihydropterin-6-yl-methyl-4-(beta-D-ribofuranosyl)aminobenzene 5'-phosphate synthase